jgi:hypothetical protein
LSQLLISLHYFEQQGQDFWSVFTRPGSIRKQEQKQMARVYSTLEQIGLSQKGEE